MARRQRLPVDRQSRQDSGSPNRRGVPVHVTAHRSPDALDVNRLAALCARVVERIATEDEEAMRHAS